MVILQGYVDLFLCGADVKRGSDCAIITSSPAHTVCVSATPHSYSRVHFCKCVRCATVFRNQSKGSPSTRWIKVQTACLHIDGLEILMLDGLIPCCSGCAVRIPTAEFLFPVQKHALKTWIRAARVQLLLVSAMLLCSNTGFWDLPTYNTPKLWAYRPQHVHCNSAFSPSFDAV